MFKAQAYFKILAQYIRKIVSYIFSLSHFISERERTGRNSRPDSLIFFKVWNYISYRSFLTRSILPKWMQNSIWVLLKLKWCFHIRRCVNTEIWLSSQKNCLNFVDRKRSIFIPTLCFDFWSEGKKEKKAGYKLW